MKKGQALKDDDPDLNAKINKRISGSLLSHKKHRQIPCKHRSLFIKSKLHFLEPTFSIRQRAFLLALLYAVLLFSFF